jgi:hypothetical protein
VISDELGKPPLFIQTSLWWKTTYDAENGGESTAYGRAERGGGRHHRGVACLLPQPTGYDILLPNGTK